MNTNPPPDERVVRLPFPKDGPLSSVLATAYPHPRWLYLWAFFFWSSLTIGRWLMIFSNQTYTIVLYWNSIDCLLCLLQALWMTWHLIVSHHRWRYLGARPCGDIAPENIVHVLCVLHATESPQRLYDIVSDLSDLPCEGKKILFLGMEKVTPDIADRVEAINRQYGDAFSNILYTVHALRDGEIVGTGSNHFEAQVAAEAYFDQCPDKSNIIFSKFDTNMRLDKDKKLLEEIETVWCMVDRETRRGITFMPNVYWSGDKKDRERPCMEKFVSFSMSTLLQQSSFSMAFVSGSLEGVCAVGYTPPSLLAEDDLTFSKKNAMLPKPRTYRLCSAILKVFDSGRDPEAARLQRARATQQWTCAFLDKKMKRWMMGHVEKDMYIATWLILPCCLSNFGSAHPFVKNKFRTVLLILSSVLRMYLILVLPLNVVPFVMIFWTIEFHQVSFDWFYIVQFLPDVSCPWGNCAGWSVPIRRSNTTNILDNGHELIHNAHALFLFGGYWCLFPACIICIFIMFGIQRRIYKSFTFLEFNWRTIFLYLLLVFPLLLLMGPLFLLWSYLKHGCLDMPAGHMPLKRIMPCGGEDDSSEEEEDSSDGG